MRRALNESGAAMLIVLLTVTVLLLVGLALAELSRANLLLVNSERQALQALDLAEAGLHRAVAELWSNPSWAGVAGVGLSGADGTYSVTVAPDPEAPAEVIVTATGTCGRVTRTVRGRVLVMNTLDIGLALGLRDSLVWPSGQLFVNGATQIGGDLTVYGGSLSFTGTTIIGGHLSDPEGRTVATPPIIQGGPVAPLPELGSAGFDRAPLDSIDIDYPDGTRLDNSDIKGGGPPHWPLFFIAHIEGSGTVGTLSFGNNPGDPLLLVALVADGDLVLDGRINPPKDALLAVIARGDIVVSANCKLDNALLIAGGQLVLQRDLDVTGTVVADTIDPGLNRLTVRQQALGTVTLPFALQVSLLSWEEVAP